MKECFLYADYSAHLPHTLPDGCIICFSACCRKQHTQSHNISIAPSLLISWLHHGHSHTLTFLLQFLSSPGPSDAGPQLPPSESACPRVVPQPVPWLIVSVLLSELAGPSPEYANKDITEQDPHTSSAPVLASLFKFQDSDQKLYLITPLVVLISQSFVFCFNAKHSNN